MDKKQVFNDLVDYYGKLFPHITKKQQKVAEEWEAIRDIEDGALFKSALEAKKKEWHQTKLREGRKNISKFFTFTQTKPKSTEAETPVTNTVDLTATREPHPIELAAAIPVPEVIFISLIFFIRG